VEILALWALLLLTVWTFWHVRRLAGALLLPYLAWVTLAAALSYSVWRQNPGVL
jgi:tryptophan-rich sensory protein